MSDPQAIFDDHPANQESSEERPSLEERLSGSQSSDGPLTSASGVTDEVGIPSTSTSSAYIQQNTFSASRPARRRRSGGNRMALGTPEMRRQAQVARNRRVEERENEEPVPVRPGTPRLRLISDSD